MGLGSIWRFPYVVGENGGAAFVLLYLVCLLLVGLPVLLSEISIGRVTQLNPSGAFAQLGRGALWKKIGKATIFTGFLVSCFYAVIAGWTLGYLVESLFGKILSFQSSEETLRFFAQFTSGFWTEIGSLLGFLLLCFLVLYTGVQRGIERWNKIFIPLLLVMLVILAVKGLMMKGGAEGVLFLFKPDFKELTPTAILVALGQAFFSLSLGQGTMVTYGSYLTKKESLPSACFPVAFFGIAISLLAGVAIFSIVFSFGLTPSAGESLMFQTLPLIFSKMSGGYLLSLVFFFLLSLAALTSQISAMEPLISYFIDRFKWSRHRATWVTTLAVFLVAIPCALSFGPLKGVTFLGKTFFDLILFLSVNALVPLGGLAAVLLVGWRWGIKKGLSHLEEGSGALFENYPFLPVYFRLSIKYAAPLIIVLILLDAMGILKIG